MLSRTKQMRHPAQSALPDCKKCSLGCAKLMQTSGKRTCSQLPECSLGYAKLMQTSGKRTCSQLPECSLGYAKVSKKRWAYVTFAQKSSDNGCANAPIGTVNLEGFLAVLRQLPPESGRVTHRKRAVYGSKVAELRIESGRFFERIRISLIINAIQNRHKSAFPARSKLRFGGAKKTRFMANCDIFRLLLQNVKK